MAEKKKPEEWVSEVEEKRKEAENWVRVRQILVNTNYYLSNQWIVWDNTRRNVIEAPRDSNEERITHNVIRPRVMTKLAKQTKNRIKYDVMPDTNSQERIEVAKAATKFIHFWWDEQEMDRKTRDIFLNNNVKGFCAAKVYFDPDLGDDITPDEEQAKKLGMEPGKTVKKGAIVCQICDPLTIFIDPGATSDEEVRWVVQRKPRDVDYIEQKYKKKVDPEENVDYYANYDILNNSTGLTTLKQKRNSNMAFVDELWMNPNPKFPNGLKVTVAGGQLLDFNDKAGPHPYIIFGDIPVPGRVEYEAFIKDMLPVQRNLNIALTMMATTFKRMGNPQWLIPTGSVMDEDELSDEVGGFVHYTPVAGAKPERAAGVELPSVFDRIIEYYNRLIDDMSGAREVSQGRLPAGLDTATGLSLMVEQENEKLAVTSQNYEQGMKKLLQRVLMLMKKHYTEERLGRILGEDNEVELVSFTGSDLSGGEDIHIVQGSSLPEMKSAQEDRIMMLWDKGAIQKKDGSPDYETFLRLMGMGDSTELFEQHQLDENKAKMENKLFLQMMEDPQLLETYMTYQAQKQQAVQVNQQLEQAQSEGLDVSGIEPEQMPEPPKGIPLVRDFQDHEVHLYYHNVFRKSHEYDELPMELQMMVDAHVQEHEQILQAPMMAQQAQQMQAQQEQNQTEQMKVQAEQARTQAQMTHQVRMKQQDHQNNLEKIALQTAAKGGASGAT